ncbi:MAG: hypothetical protein BWY31_01481 [Lentisphaerae bacterium ADurb.Bin242]|nr:MAG: hypothetical protein BWY31_01481 [Lentisphaerae bacterium ADurb.Bin242]
MSNSMKKKFFKELPQVESFMAAQSVEVNTEYKDIVDGLERNGRLSMPNGEKVDASLFAIRVIQAGNVRIFYVYGIGSNIYGIHAYDKKMQQIPGKELDLAHKAIKILRKGGRVK